MRPVRREGAHAAAQADTARLRCWLCSVLALQGTAAEPRAAELSVCPLPTGKFNPLCTVVCNEGFSHLGYLESALNLKRKRLV